MGPGSLVGGGWSRGPSVVPGPPCQMGSALHQGHQMGSCTSSAAASASAAASSSFRFRFHCRFRFHFRCFLLSGWDGMTFRLGPNPKNDLSPPDSVRLRLLLGIRFYDFSRSDPGRILRKGRPYILYVGLRLLLTLCFCVARGAGWEG